MDAVPGRKAPMASGSAPDLMYCQPCAEDGNKILPDAFCPVCKEFLCSTCARVHRNQKITKSHALQDKTSMPSSFCAESEDEKFSVTCQHHSKEFIKYYCPRHDALLCGDCVIENENHRSCMVEKILQVAKRYKEGEEYNSLTTGLCQMVRDIENYILYIQVRMKSVDEENLTNINEFRKFRNKVNQYLDKRENELLAEIDQTKRKSKTFLNELKTKYTNIKSATEKLQSDLHAHEANSNQLLIVGKRAIKELEDLQTALEKVSMSKDVSRYTFDRDPATERLLASETAIGRLKEGESTTTLGQQQQKQEKKQQEQRKQQESKQQQHKPTQAPSHKVNFKSSVDLSQSQFSRQHDIPMKTSDDTRNCYLTSVACLSGNRILLADYNNQSVKLADTKTNMVLSEVALSGRPWDLCLLPGDRAAVTLTTIARIQFLSTKGTISLQDYVEVGVLCDGIDFCNDNLIVSFNSPGKVVLMDMEGNYKAIVDKNNGKSLFQCPTFVTVSRESKTPTIYVSDIETDVITMLSPSLQVIQTIQQSSLTTPCGMAPVGDNQLLVCGWGSNNIVLLDTQTGKITQLLGEEEGIEFPHCVAYCPQQKMMFILSYDTSGSSKPELTDFVKVFHVI